jgi:hypothetical protein
MRDFPEVNDDFTVLSCKSFSCPQVEGDIIPSPVIYKQFCGNTGFGLRVWVYTRLGEIAGDIFAVYPARAVLVANDEIIQGLGLATSASIESRWF